MYDQLYEEKRDLFLSLGDGGHYRIDVKVVPGVSIKNFTNLLILRFSDLSNPALRNAFSILPYWYP